MGYSTRNNGQIRDFEPDNTPDTLYLMMYGGRTIQDISEEIAAHFGSDGNLMDYNISAENIHTRCLGYDLYDPSDYDMYLIITKKLDN